MENQNKGVVYIYSSWVVSTLHIILPLYLPLFWLFLFPFSYYKFATLFHFMHTFLIRKRLFLSHTHTHTLSLSLSLSLKFFFFIFCWILKFFFISTLDWWIFVFSKTLLLVYYNWKWKDKRLATIPPII